MTIPAQITGCRLAEIEAAVEALPVEQQEHLLHFLTVHLVGPGAWPARSRLVHDGDDTLLEASPGSPPMSPENVRRMLADWP